MRRVVTIWILVMLAAAAYAGGQGEPAPELPVREGYTSVSSAGVNVQWSISGDEISVQLAAVTTGWVAIGFDPTRQMQDANFIIGFVRDGEVTVRDDFGIGRISHGPDVENGGTNDILSAEGEERDGVTVIRFSIPLDSGDPRDRPLAAGSSHTIIVAHGPNGADDFTTPHVRRGSVEVEL
ncbi:MAG: DOMON domain-containing protein [Spirochaetota bacterium]